ncbi:unnamed protein product [Ceratitis capitata]|nr:unnamed protein product [Ceratitis capitata]
MCDKKKEIIEQYVANDNIWNSETSSAFEKAAAWRRQIILLIDPIHELPKSESFELLQRHYNRLNSKCMDEYEKQRIELVKSLLKKNSLPPTTVHKRENCKFEDLDFEDPCHGKYESCRSIEINSSDLQYLRKCNTREDEDIIDVDVEEAQPRSSIMNFLQPRKNPNHCKGVIAKNNSNRNEGGEALNCDSMNSVTPNIDNTFKTAREMLISKSVQKQNPGIETENATIKGSVNNNNRKDVPVYFNYGITKKMLGSRRTIRSGFVLPVAKDSMSMNPSPPLNSSPPLSSSPEEVDDRLINIDPKMVDLIKNEIMHKYKPMNWDDIAGLEYVKSIIKEAVVYPILRPDIFTGLRRPPRGILLFGPPGTGKTLIGKCIASQSNSTFFSISSSSLTSKWVGESEKMVRALFAVAAVHQPSVVFIDEVDSLLSKRSESEHDSSRKLKNEFLVQLDGAATSEEDRVLIVGATNRPQELDDAARRRFARRLYIPLPEKKARIQILNNLLGTVSNDLNEINIEEIGHKTTGYSGADMDILCREASMEPLRSIPPDEIPHIIKDKV